MTRSYPWTDREILVLQRMITAGKGLDEICMVLKSRNQESIRNKCQRMGLRMARTPEIDAGLYQVLMGESLGEI